MSRGIRAGKAEILLSIRNQTQQGLRKAQRDLTSFARKTAGLGGGIIAAGLGVGGVFTPAVREFARVEQLLGRFDSVFGNLSSSSGQFADDLARNINASGLEIRDQLAQFQGVLVGAGFNPVDAEGIAQGLTKATQDLIAFDDTITSSDEAVRRLLSGLVGETEAVRRFGADVRAAAVDQELLRLGIANSAREATESQRQLARYNIIIRALGRAGATGQAIREVETLSAQLRGLRAAATDATAAIGGTIGPAIATLTGGLTKAVRNVESFAETNPDLFASIALGIPIAISAGAALTSLATALALTGVAAGGIATLGTALSGLAVPAAVLAALGATAVYAVNNIGELKDAAAGIATDFEQEFSGIKGTISETFGGIIDALNAGEIRLAADIAALGVQVAFESAISGIRNTYRGLVDEIAKGLVSVTPRDLARAYGLTSIFGEERFSNDPIAGGDGAENTRQIDEERQRRENATKARLEALQSELAESRANAATERREAEQEREQAKKAATNRNVPEDPTVSAARQAQQRSFGTFSGLTASQQFGPTVDRLKELVNKQDTGNQKLERIARSIEGTKLVAWGV